MKRSPILKYKFSNQHSNLRQAFTLVELIVSVGIFAMMTALIVAKYGNFNQSVLLTNLAYDVALTIRTAQTYGLSVKNIDPSTAEFSYAYGVYLSSVTSSNKNKDIIFFVDRNPNGKYDANRNPTELISTYAIKRGAVIKGVCASAGCTPITDSYIDITFKRPDPNAMISLTDDNDLTTKITYAEITVKGTDGSTRVITVRENGQITVKD
jgi:Tfp pilus assembly protein FimT